MLPLSTPALAALGAIQFTSWCTTFVCPLLITTGKLDALALNTFRGSNATQWRPIMAGSTLAVVPIVIVSLLAQRYFGGAAAPVRLLSEARQAIAQGRFDAFCAVSLARWGARL